MSTTFPALVAPTPTEVVARAERRLVPMVARRAPHDRVLRAFAAYERMHADAVTLQRSRDERDVAVEEADLTALLGATTEHRTVYEAAVAAGHTPGCATAQHMTMTSRCTCYEDLVPPALLANARAAASRTGGAR